jgi:hypothetical protein
MADLLECLIQIKALRVTLDMATRRMSPDTPAGADGDAGSEAWRRMADAELRYAEALATATDRRPVAGVELREAPDARELFVARRRANLAMLEECTAAQLSGFVEWPERPSTSVADVAAIMLASDTEVLGELRRSRLRPTVPRLSLPSN